MKKQLLFVLLFIVFMSLLSGASYAHSINYSEMEKIFGEPVTTSATGKPQRMSEVPMTMEVLTQEDIRRSGAENIPEVLRQVNGVSVVQKTETQYDVSIRGYNQHQSQRLLVLVNGRQVYLDHYGFTEWETIPVRMEEIRQIEIVKGPNTALFGFNAVNGVINIVTYNPIYDDVSSAGVTLGTSDYREGHYVQTMKLSDKVSTRVSAGIMRAVDYDNPINSAASVDGAGTTRSGFNEPEKETLNVDTMFQVTEDAQIRMEVSGSNTQGPILSSPGSLNNAEYETKAVKLSYELDAGDLGLVKANIYKNFLDIETFSSMTLSDMDQDVLVVQLEDTFKLNTDHTIRFQGEYRASEFSGNAAIISPDAEVSYDVFAASSMWNWIINNQLNLTNAVRVDRLELGRSGSFTSANPYTNSDYNQSMTEYSYNSGLLWKPTEKDTLRLSTARGLEVPSLIEFGLDLSYGSLAVVGDPRLDAAVVTNYELAWDRKVDKIDGLFRSAVFYNKTKDIKVLTGPAVGALVSSANIGDSDSYGIELELQGKLNEAVDWGVGYIYQEIDDTLDNSKTATTIDVEKEYEDSNPRHQINVKLGYKQGLWEVDGLAYYVSDTTQYALNAASVGVREDVDSYVGLNARVGYTLDDGLTLAVHGQQLQSSNVQTSVTPDVDRRVYLSLTKNF